MLMTTQHFKHPPTPKRVRHRPPKWLPQLFTSAAVNGLSAASAETSSHQMKEFRDVASQHAKNCFVRPLRCAYDNATF